MNILLIAPNIDGTDVGEAYVAFKWAEALATRVNLTVLSFERPGRVALAAQLPLAKVFTWPEPAWARRNERLNAMLKPCAAGLGGRRFHHSASCDTASFAA